MAGGRPEEQWETETEEEQETTTEEEMVQPERERISQARAWMKPPRTHHRQEYIDFYGEVEGEKGWNRYLARTQGPDDGAD